jgi:hypothetical protein
MASIAQREIATDWIAAEPPKPKTWTIYKVAAEAILLGTVEAPDKRAAIKKAAEEFKTEAWRLCAVQRR